MQKDTQLSLFMSQTYLLQTTGSRCEAVIVEECVGMCVVERNSWFALCSTTAHLINHLLNVFPISTVSSVSVTKSRLCSQLSDCMTEVINLSNEIKACPPVRPAHIWDKLHIVFRHNMVSMFEHFLHTLFLFLQLCTLAQSQTTERMKKVATKEPQYYKTSETLGGILPF